jgi:uncharacterized membrane protein
MSTARLETFSDGVIAILITIMVLELPVPEEPNLDALMHEGVHFVAYALSFVMLGIYWNNHHHMLAVTEHINGGILWANLHLLFWLSLIPFATAWMGRTGFDPVATAVYGVAALLCAIAYYILQTAIIREQGPDSRLAKAVGDDIKGKLSPMMYLAAIVLASVSEWISLGLYIAVALMWLIPDRRIARAVEP